MKICIFGAGAIGGYVGTKLALSGADVSFIARGPNLQVIKEKGVKLLSEGQTLVAHPAPPTTLASSAHRTTWSWPSRRMRFCPPRTPFAL